jgi:hypothetical protein
MKSEPGPPMTLGATASPEGRAAHGMLMRELRRLDNANSRGRWKMFTPSQRAPSSPTSAAIDDGNLGSAQRMHPKEARVQPDAGDPMGDQPGVLLRRYRLISAARAAKEEFARAFIGGCDIIFDRLSRMETHPSLRGRA